MKNKFMALQSSLALATYLVAISLFNGCVGYKLGSTLPADIKTINIPVFVNKTSEPQLETATTSATLREFQKEGSLHVMSDGMADTTLKVTITNYKLVPLRFQRNQAKTTSEYRMNITVNLVLTRTRTGQVLLNTSVTGDITFEPGGDLSTAKTAALPAAARDLAHRIVESVVEFW